MRVKNIDRILRMSTYVITEWAMFLIPQAQGHLEFLYSGRQCGLYLLLLCGAGGYKPNVLQPFETYCTNPALVFPFHLQRRFTSTGVRDLCQRKVELWARNVRSNLAI
jgi:hypothetical protein